MAPDMLTIPVVPESRLKAMVQANALVHAIASAACFGLRGTLTDVLGLGSAVFVVCLGFAFAFHAMVLFRISMKEPLPRRVVIGSAVINLLSAVTMTVILIVHMLNVTTVGVRLLAGAAVIHSVIAVALLFLSLHSSYSYSPTEMISL